MNELSLARITAVHRGRYQASFNDKDISVSLAGKFQYGALTAAEYPAVGDWVKLSPEYIDERGERSALIEEVLPRKSKISRVEAGSGSNEQIFATNIDYAMIVTSANSDFNSKRLHRYLLMASEGNVNPVIVLSKADLCEDIEALLATVKSHWPQWPVIATSVESSQGISSLREMMKSETTSVFLGSSGVGKSTLVNTLLEQQVQLTQEIRQDDEKGKHTTTSRELFAIPGGGWIIDTPGIRELQVFGSEQSLQSVFSNIDDLNTRCKYSDCQHDNEPGCALREALQSGQVNSDDYDNYVKLQKEMAHSNRKMDKQLSSNQKKKWRQITVNMRQRKKLEGR